MNTYDRRGAAVYYDWVKESAGDGTYKTTFYSQGCSETSCDLVSGTNAPSPGSSSESGWTIASNASRVNAVLYKRGENRTVVQSNWHIHWGQVIGVDANQGGQNLARTARNLNVGVVSRAWTGSIPKAGAPGQFVEGNLFVFFRPESNVVYERASVRGMTTRTDYAYNALFQPKTTTTSAANLPTTGSTVTYGYESGAGFASTLKSANRLSDVVRTDRFSVSSGGTKVYEASTTTTLGNTADPQNRGTTYRPYRSYRWVRTLNATSPPSFSAWTGPDQVGGWVLASTVNAYDRRGRAHKTTDARGGVTELHYCSNTSNFDCEGTANGGPRLTGVRKRGGSIPLAWGIDYDLISGQPSSVTDATGSALYRTFTYDQHGRLETVQLPGDANANSTAKMLSRHHYNLLGSAATASNPSNVRTVNYVAASLYVSAVDSVATTQYFDGRGRVIQAQQQDGGYTLFSSTDYDAFGRTWRTWNAGRVYNGTGGFVPNHHTEPRGKFSPSNTRPYAEQTYDAYGRPSLLHLPSGDGVGAARTEAQYDQVDPQSVLQITIPERTLALDRAIDPDGNTTEVYTNAFGQQRLHRTLATYPVSAGIPGNEVVASSCGQGGPWEEGPLPTAMEGDGAVAQGAPPGEPEAPEQSFPGGGDIAPMDVNQDCQQFDESTFTVPFVIIAKADVTLSRSSSVGTRAEYRFERKVSSTSWVTISSWAIWNGANDQRFYDRDITFLAIPGQTYRVVTTAKGSSQFGGDAAARVELTFSKDGFAFGPLDTMTEYDAHGRPVKIMPPKYFETTGSEREAHATRHIYDGLGRVMQTTTPDAGTVHYCYDRSDRLRFTKHASGLLQYWKYDALGREVESGRLPDATPFATACSKADEDAWPGLSDNPSEQVIKTYDAAEPTTGTYALVRDGAYDRLPSEAGRNLRGQLSSVLSQSGFTGRERWQLERYSYSSDGLGLTGVQVHTEGLGKRSDFVSRALRTDGSERQRVVRHYYTSTGTSSRFSKTTPYYNALQQVHEVDVRVGVGSSQHAQARYTLTYDEAGRVKTTAFGATTMPNHYDVRGRLIQSGDPGSANYPFSSRYTYTDGGRVRSWEQTHKSGTTFAETARRFKQDFTYDGAGRLLGANYSHWGNTYRFETTSAFDVSGIGYDGNGNITALRRNDGAGNPLDVLAYQYQSGTNRAVRILDSGDGRTGAGTYSCNPSGSSTPLRYDADGALIADCGFGYGSAERNLNRYIINNRLKQPVYIKVNDRDAEDSQHAYYYYGASGGRFMETTRLDGYAQGTLRYNVMALPVAGRRQPVEGVFTGDYAETLDYWNVVLPSGAVVGRIDAQNQVRYYVQDHLGSTRAVVDASGTILEKRDHYPFGLEMPGRVYVSGSPTRENFTGHEKDAETGLLYMGARYYMPALGRFTSTDPAGQYASPYVYAGNNPISLVDPDGRFALPPDDHIFRNGRYSHTVRNDRPDRIINVTRGANRERRQVIRMNDAGVDSPLMGSAIRSLRFVGGSEARGIMDRGTAGAPDGNPNLEAIAFGASLVDGVSGNEVPSPLIAFVMVKSGANGSMDPMFGGDGPGAFDTSIGLFSNDAQAQSQMYVIGGTAYNAKDFGNFLWGGMMAGLGFWESIAQGAAHANNAANGAAQNPDHESVPLLDWRADQNAIENGHRWRKDH
jgi:RHS repeat-associated protein